MQLSSGKIISNPSDNPIIASRALRFRTNVTEIEQFSRNTNQAISWMEVSEEHLNNQSQILSRARSELLVQGASSTYTWQNRQTITRVIELMFDQMHTEMNGTFAGRYVFSGFRTDQPPIITNNNLTTAVPPNTVDYDIHKMINRRDINQTGSLYWQHPGDPSAIPPVDPHLVKVASQPWLDRPDRDTANWEAGAGVEIVPADINIVKLPYHQADNRNMTTPDIPGFSVVRMNLAGQTLDPAGTGVTNPYTAAVPGTIIFIEDTGELIIDSADLDRFGTGAPAVAARAEFINLPAMGHPGGATIVVNGAQFTMPPFATPNGLASSLHGVSIAGSNPPASFVDIGGSLFIVADTAGSSAINFTSDEFDVFAIPGSPARVGVPVQYRIDGTFAGELNPRIFFHTADRTAGLTFSQENQEIQFELGTNVHLTINTQARHAYPWQMFADMQAFLGWVNSVSITEGLTAEEQAMEQAFFGEMLYTKFTNLMSHMDVHIQTTTTEFTALGARMERMEMISERLLENRDTFRALRDQNENVDYLEVMMRLNAMEAVFQAALQAGARISQLSLANFI